MAAEILLGNPKRLERTARRRMRLPRLRLAMTNEPERQKLIKCYRALTNNYSIARNFDDVFTG